MNAYLIAGCQSSGNRFLTEILLRAGCCGSADVKQPESAAEIPNADRPFAMFRHHNLGPALGWLRERGYDPMVLLIVREQVATARSMAAAGHVAPPSHRRDVIASVINECYWSSTPWEIVPYESIRPEMLTEWLPAIGLSGRPEQFVDLACGDRNEQHYVESEAEATALLSPIVESLGGWCSTSKAVWLWNHIRRMKPKTVVEIGVWAGRSLVPMAMAVKRNGVGRVFGIDPWDATTSLIGVKNERDREWWREQDADQQFRNCAESLRSRSLGAELIRNSSTFAAGIWDHGSIDLLHLDGNHAAEPAMADIVAWEPHVARGGTIVFDDASWMDGDKLSTRPAIRELYRRGWRIEDWAEEDCPVLRSRLMPMKSFGSIRVAPI